MDDTEKGIVKLNAELRELISEMTLLIKTVDNKREEVISTTEASLKKFNKSIKDLAEENVLLQRLPKKIDSQLAETIPDIAVELDRISAQQVQELKKAHKQSIEEHNNAIVDAALKLEQIKEEICKIDGMRIKRYFMNLGSVMIISVLASLGVSYALIEHFPNKVSIDYPNNVTIQNSEVSMWSSKNVKTSGKEKIIKY